MNEAVVLGKGRRVRPGAVRGLETLTIADVANRPHRYRRLLVIGSTADVAAVAAATPGTPLAFAGAPELRALFALDPSLESATDRLAAGTEYPADLGQLHLPGTSRPFLATVTAGGGSVAGARFPWAHGSGEVTVQGRQTIRVERGRAVIVANTQRLGQWIVAPRSALNDARLDIQVLSGPMSQLLRLRPALRMGQHERSPRVRRLSAAECHVLVPPRWRLRCDGVAVGSGPFRVSLHPLATVLLV